MNCQHRKMAQTTAWTPYAPRRPGILHKQLIRRETCQECGKERVSSTEGIRAVRERADALSNTPDSLRYGAREREILARMITAAEPGEEGYVSRPGAWMRVLKGAISTPALDELLARFLYDGLVTIETSRSRKKHGVLTAVMWPADQYLALRDALKIDEERPALLQSALNDALQKGAHGGRAVLTEVFWTDQLDQLQHGRAQVLDVNGDVVLTSAASHYPDVLAATLVIGQTRSPLLSFKERNAAVDEALESIYGEAVSSLLPGRGPEIVRFHGSLQADHAPDGDPVGLRLGAGNQTTLLIVQARSVYERLQAARVPTDMIVAHLGGRPSTYQSEILGRIGRTVDRTLVWCELDPVGVSISDAIIGSLHSSPATFLMDAEAWSQFPKRPLSSVRQRYAAILSDGRSTSGQLAAGMVNERAWVPQEVTFDVGCARLGIRPAPGMGNKPHQSPRELKFAAHLVGLSERRSEIVEIATVPHVSFDPSAGIYVEKLSSVTFRLLLGPVSEWLADNPRATITAMNIFSPNVAFTPVLRRALQPNFGSPAGMRIEISQSAHLDGYAVREAFRALTQVEDRNMKKSIEMFEEGNSTSDAAAAVRSFAASVELAVNARQRSLNRKSLSGGPLDEEAQRLTDLPVAAFERARVFYNRTKHVDENEGQRKLYEDAMAHIHKTVAEARDGARATLIAVLRATR